MKCTHPDACDMRVDGKCVMVDPCRKFQVILNHRRRDFFERSLIIVATIMFALVIIGLRYLFFK